MDEDIETGRRAVQDLLAGLAKLAHRVTDTTTELSEEEKAIQHDTVTGVHDVLKGLTDLGALAVAAAREED